MAVDKTGTLTLGKPAVVRVELADGSADEEPLLRVAASVALLHGRGLLPSRLVQEAVEDDRLRARRGREARALRSASAWSRAGSEHQEEQCPEGKSRASRPPPPGLTR